MKSQRIAVFPGSFDPVTKGHENIVRRALPLFDKVIIAIGKNTSKQSLFSVDVREKWLKSVFSDEEKVEVESYTGLTSDFCALHGARFMLRGVRNGGDFEYERTIAQMTTAMAPDLETVILFTDPEFAAVNSTVVREIIRNKGKVSAFVPEGIDVYAL